MKIIVKLSLYAPSNMTRVSMKPNPCVATKEVEMSASEVLHGAITRRMIVGDKCKIEMMLADHSLEDPEHVVLSFCGHMILGTPSYIESLRNENWVFDEDALVYYQ